MFTDSLKSIRKGDRSSRQPKWYCEIHRKKYHRVSPTAGVRVKKVGGLHRLRK